MQSSDFQSFWVWGHHCIAGGAGGSGWWDNQSDLDSYGQSEYKHDTMMNFGREPYIMINIWLFMSPETGLHATKETPKYFSPIMFPFILLNLTMKNHKNVKTRWSNFVLIWFFCVGSNVIWWKCFQLIAPDGPTHHCGFTENRTHKGTGGSFIKGDKQKQKQSMER